MGVTKVKRLVGEWHFRVYETADGGVLTDWEVREFDGPGGDQNEYGTVEANLYVALQAACDALGLLYPLVEDEDLKALGGLA